MNGTNRVAATLAIMAMVGFLLAFFGLGWAAVPVANKDFLNQALIALIGLVGTAFGYYLGSSQGSAQKNALLAQTAPPSPAAAAAPAVAADPPAETAAPGEGGFARLRLIVPLAFLLLLIVGVIAFSGCATMNGKKETPQSIAAKSLLSARQGIIGAAVTVDALCSKGVMRSDDCAQAREIYNDAQPAYTAAADAFLLYLVSADAAAQKKYEAAMPRLMALFTSLDTLVQRYGGAK